MGSDDSDGDRLDRAARQLELARSAPHFGVARAIFLGLVAELAASGGVPDLAECPDENALAAYVCALLSLEEIAQVERHLGKCPDRPAAGWLGAYSGDTCDSEAEALCSLVERAQRETEDAGGEAPFHLIDQLADDATVLAVYRKQTPKLARAAFRGFVEAAEAIDELDFVAEADVLGTELDALRRPAVGGA